MYYSPNHFYSPDEDEVNEDELINAEADDLEEERLMDENL